MNDEEQKPRLALWRYLRLCDRTEEVVERYKGSYPQIATFEPTLEPLTQSFRAEHRAVDLGEREARLLLKRGHREVTELETFMRSWGPTLSHHLREYDVTALVEAHVPDDVFIHGRGLVERLRFTLEDGAPTFGRAQELIDQLEVRIERAEAAWDTAQQALAELQGNRKALRHTASQLHVELVALRRALRGLLGSKNRDYKKLLVRRIRRDDSDLEQSDDVTDPITPPSSSEDPATTTDSADPTTASSADPTADAA